MNPAYLSRIFLVALLLACSPASRADLTTNWGTVASPLTSEVSFSFAQYNVTNNFTDHYNFSLEGGTGATYSVTFNFDPCIRGCGNPELSYGIYDQNGGLVSSTSGSLTLSAGNYSFQVKGTGFGSGTSVDYWGSITFIPTATSSKTSLTMVSPAPEPSTLAMMMWGLAGIGWSAWRRRDVGPRGAAA